VLELDKLTLGEAKKIFTTSSIVAARLERTRRGSTQR